MLLIWQPTIHGEEGLEGAAGPLEELAIAHSGPAPPGDGLDRMADEQPHQVVGEILIKKDAHRPRPNRGRD